jgi:hypothetical protein
MIHNNYFVEKNGNTIDVQQVESAGDVNRIHFFLLGNRFESLYLPSAIIIVEGKTDHAFLERVFSVRYRDKQLSLLNARNDVRVKEVFNICKDLFGDIQKSPYKDRVLVVLDQQHSAGVITQLEGMGLPRDNIIVWDKNGIEFYYPPEILKKIFHSEEGIKIIGDRVSAGGLEYTKNALSSLVVEQINEHSIYYDEFSKKLLSKLDQLVN